MDISDIERFAELLKNSRRAVFFGGAGVSTESGVKDYRSEDGLYNTVKQYGVPPEVILSRSFFRSKPEVFYDFYYRYFLQSSAKPNPAHIALAELEKRGILSAVVTQNIDGLHQAAGSKKVFELHGTVYKYHCSACGREFPVEKVKELKGGVPRCEACGGIIKPDVVLYEEPLDESVITGAVTAIASADLMIIGGTSLAVYPAAGLLGYYRGRDTVLINRSETQYDSRASLVFRDKIGEVMQRAVELLGN